MTGAQTILNVQAGAVLVGAVAAWILLPPEVLLPLSAVLVVLAVGGVFAIRWYVSSLRDETLIERLTRIGMAFALVGLAAFMVLLMEYAD